MTDLIAREGLVDLAERCEKASGPDRELEWRIAEAIGVGEWRQSTVWPPFMPGSKIDKAIPAYTASLDAAMTLVPDQHSYGIEAYTPDHNTLGWTVHLLLDANILGRGVSAFATTFSLALCAAALKARARAAEVTHG